MNKLKAFWNSLPHKVQAAIVIGVSTLSGIVLRAYSDPNACWTWVCVKTIAQTALHTAVSTGIAFYLLPNNGAEAPQA